MKPRSKSVWMVPAALTAVAPAGMVQARTSLSLKVKKVRNAEHLVGAADQHDTPDSVTPSSFRYSRASSGERSATSLSSWAQIATVSQAWCARA